MICSRIPLALCVASSVLALSGCGSQATTSSTASSPGAGAAANPLTECPQVAHDLGAPEWILSGAVGAIGVSGPTETTMPMVKVSKPFIVNETHLRTLRAGDGPVVAPTAKVSVCYMGVNGRDGRVFDSSYLRGTPETFDLGDVVPGFRRAITGRNVGSTLGVAMAPGDGYPEGQPSAGIEPGDSLIFVIQILEAS